MSEQVMMWCVSKGDYSDYRVMCVCPTKEAAETVCARYNANKGAYSHDDARVEALPYIDSSVQPIEILRMQANLWDSGDAEETKISVSIEWPFNMLYPEDARDVHWRWVRAPMHQNKGGRLEVAGTDHERVRRVFSDRKAMILSGEPLQRRNEATGHR